MRPQNCDQQGWHYIESVSTSNFVHALCAEVCNTVGDEGLRSCIASVILKLFSASHTMAPHLRDRGLSLGCTVSEEYIAALGYPLGSILSLMITTGP